MPDKDSNNKKYQEAKSKFLALCAEFGLERTSVIALLDNFRRKKSGLGKTDVEIISDFSALDCARMIVQLSTYKGDVSLWIGGNKQVYSPAIVEVMKGSLMGALCQMVEKKENALILKKGQGADGDRARAFVIPCAGSNPQADTFSMVELNALIDYESKKQKWVKKMEGNTERWEEEGNSRLPELGKIAYEILTMEVNTESGKKSIFPDGMKETDKYNFISEYMLLAGYLDFKPENWFFNFVNKDKYEISTSVRDWIKAYKKTLK